MAGLLGGCAGLRLEPGGAILHLERALRRQPESAADEGARDLHRGAGAGGQATDALLGAGDALLHPGGVEPELDEQRCQGARHQGLTVMVRFMHRRLR